METFKIYLENRIALLHRELEIIINKINSLPPETEINLEMYGNLRELKKDYKESVSTPRIKSIFGPTKKDLKKYIYNKELSKLERKKTKLDKRINEIQDAINSIQNGKIKIQLNNSNEIIKEYFNFSVNNNYDSNRLIKGLLHIFRNTIKTDKVESKIKQNILSFYSENDELIDNNSIDTIKLLFDKLFMVILSEKERETFSIAINSIMNKIELETASIEKDEDSKEQLLIQKRSIQVLQTYIKDGMIIKIADSIEEFQKILELSGIDDRIKSYFLENMVNKIESAKQEKEAAEVEVLLQKYLTESELMYVEKAKELENEYTGDTLQLIKRAKDDVISICKYLELTIGLQNQDESLDVLSKRVNVLKELVVNLESVNPDFTAFNYLTNSELIPYILRTIESLDITSYNSIYCLLKYLSDNKNEGIAIYQKDDIIVYEVTNTNHRLIFTKDEGVITIINIQNISSSPNIILNNSIIEKIKENRRIQRSSEYKKLQANYENLIVRSLSLNEYEELHTPKKKEK